MLDVTTILIDGRDYVTSLELAGGVSVFTFFIISVFDFTSGPFDETIFGKIGGVSNIFA